MLATSRRFASLCFATRVAGYGCKTGRFSTTIRFNHNQRGNFVRPPAKVSDCEIPKSTARRFLNLSICAALSTSSPNCNRPAIMSYTAEERGKPNTDSYRVYIKDESGKPVSPWHDIPMFADEGNKVYNMVVEIPRWTNAKMEISTKEPLNPIKQDVKKGVLRFVKNPFPHKGYIWNYGAIPQTWEDPKHVDASTGCKGDNDPIDVVEIGAKIHPRGSIVKVKVLGVMALIDEGETDWKVIVIDVNDDLATQMNDINDVERLRPGLIKATHEWFKIYKIPDGKPANEFAFNGEPKNREFAEKVIAETNKFWKELITSNGGDSGLAVKVDDANAVLSAAPVLEPENKLTDCQQVAIDQWHHITL